MPIARGRWCGRAHGARFSRLYINATKAKPMDLNTWQMTLTARVNKPAVLGMRDYLRQRGIIIPMRDRDVVAKYLHRIIENGNARTGIEAVASVTRPAWPSGAAQKGFERDTWADIRIPPHVRVRLQRLAHGAFGLLVLLACYIAFAR
ncbi:MAG TPA: hypothetical protein VGJ21_26115 [Terracidiphilus sp.]